MQVNEGSLEARGLRVAIVAARFNETVSRSLAAGAVDALRRHGVAEGSMSLTWVPGAFELPLACKTLAAAGEVDAVIAIGCVVRGKTAHFEYVAGAAATGISAAGLDTGVPVTFGVLTTENPAQAADRAGGKAGNKGAEAALAAIEMANLLRSVAKPRDER